VLSGESPFCCESEGGCLTTMLRVDADHQWIPRNRAKRAVCGWTVDESMVSRRNVSILWCFRCNQPGMDGCCRVTNGKGLRPVGVQLWFRRLYQVFVYNVTAILFI